MKFEWHIYFAHLRKVQFKKSRRVKISLIFSKMKLLILLQSRHVSGKVKVSKEQLLNQYRKVNDQSSQKAHKAIKKPPKPVTLVKKKRHLIDICGTCKILILHSLQFLFKILTHGFSSLIFIFSTF